MPSTATIISIYPVAQYLAALDIQKRGLYGGGVDIDYLFIHKSCISKKVTV